MQIKFVFKSVLLALCLLIVLAYHPKSEIGAILLGNTECDIADPSFPAPNYCRDQCDNIVESEPNVGAWCDDVVGSCSPELNDSGTANACDCDCANPSKQIECYFDTHCPNSDDKCVAGECKPPGSNVCNPQHASPGSDCWNPQGPCDPNNPSHDIAYCIDDGTNGDSAPGDGVGICLCSTDSFFGGTPRPTPTLAFMKVFCDDSTNPPHSTADNTGKLYTAIGCIPYTETPELIGFFLLWALGIGGGLAFILIIYASYLIITSAGDPAKFAAGKELLTAAISGVVGLIFSVFLLRLIGVQILNIPGF